MKTNDELARDLFLGDHTSMLKELQYQQKEFADNAEFESYLDYLLIQLKNEEYYDPILELAFENNNFLQTDIKKSTARKGLEISEATGKFIERRIEEIPIVISWIQKRIQKKEKSRPRSIVVQSLKLKNISKKDVDKLFDALCEENYLIHSKDNKIIFRKAFFDGITLFENTERLKWLNTNYALKYLINCFKNNDLFENLKDKGHWGIVINIFRKEDGSEFEIKNFKGNGTRLNHELKNSIEGLIRLLKTAQNI